MIGSDLDAIYASLPKLACKKKCQQSCGPIVAAPEEEARMIVASGGKALGYGLNLGCSYLTLGGLCSVYAARPLLCRLWGIAEEMPCPWGCVPARWLTRAETNRLFREAGYPKPNREMAGRALDRLEAVLRARSSHTTDPPEDP